MSKIGKAFLSGILLLGTVFVTITFYLLRPHWSTGDRDDLNVVFNGIYTLSSILLFLMAVLTGIVVYRQVTYFKTQVIDAKTQIDDARKTRHRALLLELFKQYSTKEMHEAINAVSSKPVAAFAVFGSEEDFQRRMVSRFFNLLAKLIRRQIIDKEEEDIFFEAFPGTIRLWPKIKEIEKPVSLDLYHQMLPDMEEARIQEIVQRSVETSDTEWLYQRWVGRIRDSFEAD